MNYLDTTIEALDCEAPVEVVHRFDAGRCLQAVLDLLTADQRVQVERRYPVLADVLRPGLQCDPELALAETVGAEFELLLVDADVPTEVALRAAHALAALLYSHSWLQECGWEGEVEVRWETASEGLWHCPQCGTGHYWWIQEGDYHE